MMVKVWLQGDIFSLFRLKICQGCRTLYYCGVECQALHWAAGHKKDCKVLGKIHQDVKEEGRGGEAASAQASDGELEPKQGSKVVDDLVAKLKRRNVFFEDNIYLYDEEGRRKETGDFMINKFKFYTAFFSDDEVANLEESGSFEDMETYFNLLVTKYSKVVGEVPKGWKGWEESGKEDDGGEDEKDGAGTNKGRKSKKNENKRKLRRKLL